MADLGTDSYVAYYAPKSAMTHMTGVTVAKYAGAAGVRERDPSGADGHVHDADFGAEELKRVRVTRIPMGWMGDTRDIRETAVFFASEDARFIIGQTLVVDGGMTLRV